MALAILLIIIKRLRNGLNLLHNFAHYEMGCRVMTFFYPIAPKKHLPQNSVLFGMDSSAGDVFFLLLILFFGRKKPLAADF